MAEVRYTTGSDTSIAYTTIGDGPVDLVFIGGFVSHIEIITEFSHARRFWGRLGRSFRIILFDKRGMGLSDRDGSPYTLEGVCEDIDAVLDATGSERAVVFGVSEGGAAASMYAATRPQRTQTLIVY